MTWWWAWSETRNLQLDFILRKISLVYAFFQPKNVLKPHRISACHQKHLFNYLPRSENSKWNNEMTFSCIKTKSLTIQSWFTVRSILKTLFKRYLYFPSLTVKWVNFVYSLLLADNFKIVYDIIILKLWYKATH